LSQKYIGKLTLLVQSKEELTDCKDGDTLINPGPNFAWHADGYDKLKPYGFPIHGCIDGFSRRLIWLKVSRTNNDPAVVAGFFFEAVQSAGGCPTILRTDNGTENTVMASVQSYLRSDSQDEHAGIFQCKLSVKKISFATSFFMNQTLTL
jgi:hypothetical protein